MNELHKSFIAKNVWVAIVVFSIRCLISWAELSAKISLYSLFGFAGEAIGITFALMVFYERKLWKYNPLESTPVLSKKYTGTLTSTYDRVERAATLEIKQTLFSIHITMATNESKSKSISAAIEEIFGEKQLVYCYLNTPEAKFRDRSEIHFGTAKLCVDKPDKITGQYYTDRKTVGDMCFIATE